MAMLNCTTLQLPRNLKKKTITGYLYPTNFSPQQNAKFIQCTNTISMKLHTNKTVKVKASQSAKIAPPPPSPTNFNDSTMLQTL